MKKLKLNGLWLPRGIALIIPLYLTILYVSNRNFYFDIWIFGLWIVCLIVFFAKRNLSLLYFFCNLLVMVPTFQIFFLKWKPTITLVNNDFVVLVLVISLLIVPFNTNLFHMFESKVSNSKFAWKNRALWIPRVMLILAYCLLLISFSKDGFFDCKPYLPFIKVIVPLFFALTFLFPMVSSCFFIIAAWLGPWYLIEANTEIKISGFSLISAITWLTILASILLVILYLYPNLVSKFFPRKEGDQNSER